MLSPIGDAGNVAVYEERQRARKAQSPMGLITELGPAPPRAHGKCFIPCSPFSLGDIKNVVSGLHMQGG